jgi:hypothetical protein
MRRMKYVIVSRKHWNEEELKKHTTNEIKWLFGD